MVNGFVSYLSYLVLFTTTNKTDSNNMEEIQEKTVQDRRNEAIRFQLLLDTDSVFITTAPIPNKSRVIVSNLGYSQVKSILEQLQDVGIVDEDGRFKKGFMK